MNTLQHIALFPVCRNRISDGAQGHMHMCLCKVQKAIQETSVNEGGKRHKRERDKRQNKENNTEMRDGWRGQKQIINK